MSAQNDTPLLLTSLASLARPLIAAGLMSMALATIHPLLPIAVLGLATGPLAIWIIVRGLNQRETPLDPNLPVGYNSASP